MLEDYRVMSFVLRVYLNKFFFGAATVVHIVNIGQLPSVLSEKRGKHFLSSKQGRTMMFETLLQIWTDVINIRRRTWSVERRSLRENSAHKSSHSRVQV